MPSPFPGMNPYLENPEFWTEVHHLLISVLAETLNPQLLPKYRASVEKRIYQTTEDGAVLVGIPDVTIGQFKQSNSNTAVADLYGFNLRDLMPRFSLPLRNQELEPTIDLHALLDIVYDRAGYEFAIDYTENSVPPLSEEDRSWSDSLLIANGYHVDLVS
jgi:Protein of unknown function (DUF4058)